MNALASIVIRLAAFIPQLLGILLASFFLLKLIPGDPAPMMLGPLATAEAVAKLRAELGLDQSLPVQFWHYLTRLLHGDLGRSWQTTNPVLTDLIERLPPTLELVMLGLGVALLIGVPLGLAAGRNPMGRIARLSDGYALGAGAMPDFWIGLVLIYVFYTLLGWAPAPLGRLDFAVLPPPRLTGSYAIDALLAGDLETFRAAAGQLVLPVVTLGLVNAVPILKMTRSTVERFQNSDFVRFADAKGLSERRVSWHILRNALPSIITVTGMLLATLLGGAVLIEVVFAWGGAGQYAVSAVLNADINAALGFVLVTAVISLGIHLAVDLICFALDPRLQLT
jgi:ABC-type dipeptide/oligopeptide/nickel transport system permease component